MMTRQSNRSSLEGRIVVECLGRVGGHRHQGQEARVLEELAHGLPRHPQPLALGTPALLLHNMTFRVSMNTKKAATMAFCLGI